MSRASVLVSVAVVSAVIGFSGHMAWDRYSESSSFNLDPGDKELHLGMRGLVNPLLDCGTGSVSSLKEAQIRDSVEKFVAEAKAKGNVAHLSVYYRDLNNGPMFGINAAELFTPASLLKVPIMIAYLKIAEQDPTLMQKKIVYDPKKYTPGNVTQNIAPPPLLNPGQEYTIEELIFRMIVDSDNIAAAMLAEQNLINVETTLAEMGVPVVVSEGQVWLRVVSYASIFRILYNATYLNAHHSSIALGLLTKSKFKKGLIAELPGDMLVAHKFGERGLGSDLQLHDCGIVYRQKSPYLLCVMSRGKDFDQLAATIRSVSKIVFTATEAQ